MYANNEIPNRQINEELILFLRRHGIIVVGHIISFIFLALMPIALYFFLSFQYPEIFQIEIVYTIALLVVSLYYLYLLLFFFNAFIDYYLDVWIVTNKRIIDIEQKGLFNRMISEHELDKIQDVTAEQKGIFQTLFKFGNVYVQTAADVPMFQFLQVKQPFEIAKTINHLLKESPGQTDAQKQYFNRLNQAQGPANSPERDAPPPAYPGQAGPKTMPKVQPNQSPSYYPKQPNQQPYQNPQQQPNQVPPQQSPQNPNQQPPQSSPQQYPPQQNQTNQNTQQKTPWQ